MAEHPHPIRLFLDLRDLLDNLVVDPFRCLKNRLFDIREAVLVFAADAELVAVHFGLGCHRFSYACAASALVASSVS